MRQINPNVAVFPNQIAILPPLPVTPQTETVTLFFGALNREEDWQDIMPEINRITAYYGKKLNLNVVHVRQFYDSLQAPSKRFTEFCPYETYKQLLSAADIAILPLQPNRFNSMKSDLKFLECAAHGTVALASPVVYDKTILVGPTRRFFGFAVM